MTWSPLVHTTSLAIGIVAVAIVFGTVYLEMQDTSPGDFAAAHAQHAGLAGPQNCEACHGQNGQSMSAACLDCHHDVNWQLNVGFGFHGKMSDELAADCAKCHSEHHGNEFAITNDRSFALAGVSDPRQFQHQGLDFHLAGKHGSVGCQTCHPNAGIDVLPIGEKRFMGLSQNCTSCHRDVHNGNYGNDCASCHGQQHPFSRVAEFEHTLAFELAGSHGKAACAACHQRDSPDSVVALLSFPSTADRDQSPIRECRACHASPHHERFLVAVSRELKTSTGNSCQHCHEVVDETFVGSRETLDASLHACSGFSLEAPHDRLQCVACHVEFGQPKSQLGIFHDSYPGRHPDDCKVCHGDPHQGQFVRGSSRGEDCLACHQRTAFVPAAFTITHHAQTRFPLLGEHSHVACNECHKLATGQFFGPRTDRASPSSEPTIVAQKEPAWVRVFAGTSRSCRDCHDDPHQGQFESGPFRGNDCQACHDEHSFRQPTFTIEQHAETRFPLTGAHAAVACNSCHRRPAEQSRPAANDPGIESRLFHGTPTQCSSCHADVHDGQFDQRHLPAIVGGNSGCARCHTTESFQDRPAVNFDHAMWTGYELAGAHARARCTDCHTRSQPADSHSRTFGRVAGRDCQSCHSDPHVGQFGPTAEVNCKQCHVAGDSFRELVFDHRLHSRFRLDRDHEKLACTSCHKPQQLLDGRTAIRYKPLGTTCGDCHVARGPRIPGLRGQR